MPSSSLLLLISVVLMLFASFSGVMLISELESRDLVPGLLSALLVLMFYSGLLAMTGFARRTVQTLTCIIGCGALLTMLSIAEFVMFRPFVGQNLAGTVAGLISLWSIPVEGHVLSRAIGQHWFIGVAIAVVAAILQLVIQQLLTVSAAGAD